jgi:hypothetical protein
MGYKFDFIRIFGKTVKQLSESFKFNASVEILFMLLYMAFDKIVIFSKN